VGIRAGLDWCGKSRPTGIRSPDRPARRQSLSMVCCSIKSIRNQPPTAATTTLHFYDSKSKGLPQQAEVAQGAPSRLRSRIFLTFRHYKGGSSSAKRTGRLYSRRNPWYSLSEAESTSGHVVLSRVPRKKSPVTPPGIDPGTVRLVVQRLNHYATPGPSMLIPCHNN